MIAWAILSAMFYGALVVMTAMVPTTEAKSMPGPIAGAACIAAGGLVTLLGLGIGSLF